MRNVPDVPAESSSRLWPENWLWEMDLDSAWKQHGPRVVDLGCGKGRFLLAHARRHPEARLLGIERKLRRIRKIDRKAAQAGLENLRLLRMEAVYAMRHLMPAGWMDRCFILFPDPWPKECHRSHRLMSPEFFEVLDHTLSAVGEVQFATDHAPYFESVQETLASDSRWTDAPPYSPEADEVSDFELQWRAEGKAIYRLAFRRA
jgi:tRNA (guanine-N7-)-methyltransferase